MPDPIPYLTNDQELTSIADAIRTRGGTSATLEYPTDFVSAIEAIPSGGDVNVETSKSYAVSASGAQTISPSMGYDAMAAVALSVPAGSATTPSATILVEPEVTVDSTGLVLATVSEQKSLTPTVSAGYISSGTAGTISISGSNTSQLSTQSGGTITPTEAEQTAVAAGKYTLGAVKVGAISSTYVGSGIDQNDSTDLTVSGATVTAPAGYYAENASKSISTGTATSASSITGTGATASSSGTTITLTKSVSNTPRITTAGYISSGTAGSSSVSLSATDADFLPENIKKNISIFGKTGTYEGSGGSVTLKMGVIRPDAELLQTWSADYLLHNDKGVTIPSYSTTATTLLAGGTALTPTVTLSNANYRYYLIQRFLTIPQYNITTRAKGRQEYTAMSMCYEIVAFPADTFSALVNTTKYASRNTAMIPAGNSFIRNVYWSSGTALSIYTANTYGCAQTIQTAPAISSGTAASPTLTVYTPNATIRGSTTYLVNTFYNAITDIRCQYIIELYRVPASTASTYGIDGWGHYTQMLHNITCAQSSTHKLT